jgi:hypothetical protein
MKLSISNEVLKIELGILEKILSFRGSLVIPLKNMGKATTKPPETCWWRDIRMPGTYFPGLIKAGTYYTRNGKEFWFVVRDKKYLTIELENESYKRIVLGLDENEQWAEKINQEKAKEVTVKEITAEVSTTHIRDHFGGKPCKSPSHTTSCTRWPTPPPKKYRAFSESLNAHDH